MKRITGKQVSGALGWYYHDKPKESRRVMCDAAAETLNALAAACSYESAHRLLREARDFLEVAEFKDSENAVCAQDVCERIAIELGEWNDPPPPAPAPQDTNTSEGAAIREDAGRAETDTTPRTATPSDASPAAWTEEQLQKAEDIGEIGFALWKIDDPEVFQRNEWESKRSELCAEIAKHAPLFSTRTISEAEYTRAVSAGCEVYWLPTGGTVDAIVRAALSSIGIATEGT